MLGKGMRLAETRSSEGGRSPAPAQPPAPLPGGDGLGRSLPGGEHPADRANPHPWEWGSRLSASMAWL